MKRITLILLLTALSCGLLIGMAQTEKPADTLNVKVAALKGPSGFGIIRLFEEEPLLGEGITTEYEVVGSPVEMVARITSGEVDAALLPSNLAAKLYLKGPGYPLGAITGDGLLHLVSSDPEIEDWSDIRGREIHITGKGATPDFLAQYLAQAAGMDPAADLNLNFSMEAPQIAQMMIAGKVHSAVLPDPFATMVKVKGKAQGVREITDFQEAWNTIQGSSQTYPITALVISPRFIEARPDGVKTLLEAYAESIDWVNANPKEAGVLIEKFGILSADLAALAIPNCNLRFTYGYAAQETMEQFLSVLLAFNPASVGGTLPDDAFYYRP